MCLLTVENEVVSSDAKVDRHIATQQDEGEDVSMFSSSCEKELVRVFSVGDGAPKPGKPMEDNWWFPGVGEKQLANDVGYDTGNTENKEEGSEEEKGKHRGDGG